MIRLRLLVACTLTPLLSLGATQATAAEPPAATAPTAATLYQRLGGGPALTAVVDDMLARAAADRRVNPKLANADLARLRAQLLDQLCALTGGPCQYRGKDMKTTHRGMGITGAEFDALVDDLKQALGRFKVPAREQGELVALLAPTKPDIVEPKGASTAAPAAAAAAAAAPAPAPAAVTGAAGSSGQTAAAPPPAANPIGERAEGLREAARLLEKADVERKRGNRSLGDQLFSFAELIVGVDALAGLAPLFREGAPPRVTTPTTPVAKNAAPQPATAGSSDDEEPAALPAKGSLSGNVKVGGADFEGFAVVTLEPASGRFRRRAARHRIVEQRNRQFAPRVLVVPTGSTVTFPNFDNVYHNVYSRSESRPFDLGLYKAGEEREMKFDKEGILRIGCNLHANMSALIAVVSAPHYVITDAHGHFGFRSLDPGSYKLRAYVEGDDGPVSQTVTVAPTRNTATITLQTAPKATPSTDKFGIPRAQKPAH